MLCLYPQLINARKGNSVRPCGQCSHCRHNQRRVLTNRIMCERVMHKDASFVTLTYRDDDLPDEWTDPDTGVIYPPLSLRPDHANLLKHRIQKYGHRKYGLTPRYFGVGEYGDKTERPHYHYALYGVPHCPYGGGRVVGRHYEPCRCPVCSFLSTLWPHGNVHSAPLEYGTAQYIGGYVNKKLTNSDCWKQDGYNGPTNADKLDGRHPEFMRSSRMPGIGASYIDKLATILKPRISDISQVPTSIMHSGKNLPMGRYMLDRLYKNLGFEFEDGERLKRYEKTLQDMFVVNPAVTPQQKKALYMSPINGLAIALEMLNAQHGLNLNARLKYQKRKQL